MIPIFSQARLILRVVVICLGIAGGGFLGWRLAAIGEPGRIARAAKPLCEAAIAGANEKKLAADLITARETLELRSAAIAAAAERIQKLEQEKADALSQTPDLDRIVVAPGEPWLRAPVRKPRAGAAVGPGGH